jgi:hypothetical protein
MGHFFPQFGTSKESFQSKKNQLCAKLSLFLTNANGKSRTLSVLDEWRDESESENKLSDSESIEILSAIII